MCLFLLVFPCFMAYKIARFFHLDFWLLILVSSCMLTSLQVRRAACPTPCSCPGSCLVPFPGLLRGSRAPLARVMPARPAGDAGGGPLAGSHQQHAACALQVMGTLFIYALFVLELLQDAPLERMDEIIYCVNAVSRVLEFLVALCVVAYGTWESLFGEWSWMGASVIIIHSYFNVWLRAQSGWRSFLLRREAAKKINSLPRATRGQLRDHNDVCAICFQVSPSARTPLLPIGVPAPGDVPSAPAGHAAGRRHLLQPLLPRRLPAQVALRAGHVSHVPPARHAGGHQGGRQRRPGGSAGAGPRGRGAGGRGSPRPARGGRTAPGRAARWGRRGSGPGGRRGLAG